MTDPVAKVRGRKAEQKKTRDRLGAGILAALCVVLVFLVGLYLFGPGPRSSDGKVSLFVVKSGDGISSVADRLADQHLIRSQLGFKMVGVLSGASKRLKTAEYEIPSGATPAKIAAILASGEGVKRSVVLPEGWSVIQLYARLEANPYLTGPLPPPVAEGTLNPDTYHIQRGDTRLDVIKRMQKAHTDILEDLWLNRAPDLPFSTKQEAMTLASIVEKETSVAKERRRVAGVFVNRLRKGIKLQSDPTIIYGITKGAPLRRKLFKSDVENPHPWNTYVIQGLPPSPIANPGKASIAAVLNPLKTNDLFFVADGTGGHVFAETYAEHDRNVQRWREWRAQQEAKDAALQGGE